MAKSIRVLVAEDRRTISDGIVDALLDSARRDIVAEACDPEEAVEQAIAMQPDIVITDLSLAPNDGLDSVRRINDAVPKCRILALADHHDEDRILPIVEAGASGYLVRTNASGELPIAIEALARGGGYFGPNVVKVLAMRLQRSDRLPRDPYQILTDREIRVFHLIIESKNDDSIASSLDIDTKGAGRLRMQIMKKLGFDSTDELIDYAARIGLLSKR